MCILPKLIKLKVRFLLDIPLNVNVNNNSKSQ